MSNNAEMVKDIYSLIDRLTEWWRYDKAHVLSSSGVCKPFDDAADG